MLADMPPAPPEAEVIRLARNATGMSAQSAAEATKAHGARGVSATYWRDVERGHGGRRGQQVAVKASDRALAAMARVVGVTPDQLTGSGREGAARVLEEILRREDSATPPALYAVGPDNSGTVITITDPDTGRDIPFVIYGKDEHAIWSLSFLPPLKRLSEILDLRAVKAKYLGAQKANLA
jgi:hypothetical protein